MQPIAPHVWRPLYAALAIVALVLIARFLLVPDDFGAHERGYMYGWHRKGNEAEWQAVTVKYKSTAYCKDCHEDKAASISRSVHRVVVCENCHGPALNHPDEPAKLSVDTRRELCLRCHADLPYAASGRARIPGIDPDAHYPGRECRTCHDPHDPRIPTARS